MPHPAPHERRVDGLVERRSQAARRREREARDAEPAERLQPAGMADGEVPEVAADDGDERECQHRTAELTCSGGSSRASAASARGWGLIAQASTVEHDDAIAAPAISAQ